MPILLKAGPKGGISDCLHSIELSVALFSCKGSWECHHVLSYNLGVLSQKISWTMSGLCRTHKKGLTFVLGHLC